MEQPPSHPYASQVRLGLGKISICLFGSPWSPSPLADGEITSPPCPRPVWIVLLMAAFAYLILQQRIIAAQGHSSILRRALGSDWKGKLSPLLYVTAIGLAFVLPWLSVALYAAVALIWLVPDRRIERVLTQE